MRCIRLQLNENVKVLRTNDRRTELCYGILTQEMQILTMFLTRVIQDADSLLD